MTRPHHGVAATTPVTVPYAKTSDWGVHGWLGRALAGLVRESGIAKSEIDGLIVASYSLKPDTAVTLTEYFDLSVRHVEDLTMGGACGPIALRRAARAIEAGDAEIVACIAGDTLGGDAFQNLARNFSGFSRYGVMPYGAAGPNLPFALITQNYMNRFGATREDFGRLCIAQRANAGAHAFFNRPLTMADYLSARAIVEPLHLYDCVMPCCGAEGFLVMTEERARAAALPYARVLSSMERHHARGDAPVQEAPGWDLDRDHLFDTAGLSPADMAFLQAYDDYPVIVMMQLEGLGFCAPGEAARFIRETDLSRHGGGLPLNTNGGQLSLGQAGAAGGFLGLVEGLRRITGQPHARPGAGIVSGYGTVNYDRGLSLSAVIMQAPS